MIAAASARPWPRSGLMPDGAQFVRLDGLKRYFDGSAPWLVRAIEGRPRQVVQAVDGIDITIAKGETFSLVGESGCGKSTVARLVVGLYPPTAGAIAFDGNDMAARRSRGSQAALRRRLQLTYLFISHNLAVVYHISTRVGVMYLGRLVEQAPTETLFKRPKHPYTRMLLDTIPDLDMTGRQRTPVAGEVPSPINPPTGCAFHPRCPFANDRCKIERPKSLPSEGGEVACHAIEEKRLPIEERSYAARR